MSSNSSTYPLIAFDCGNGFVKLCENGTVHSFPSFISRVTDVRRHLQEGVYSYLKGDSPHLRADSAGAFHWQQGSSARYGRNALRVGSLPNNQGKVRFGLPLLLGTLPKRDATIQTLAVTCPDPLALEDDLIAAYQGVHTVQFQRRNLSGCETVTYEVTIKRVIVQPESLGSICHAISDGQIQPSENLIAAIDLGFITSILSVYDSSGLEIPELRVVSENGCAALYQAIASRSDFIQCVSDSPQVDLIERGVATNLFRYGGEQIEFERFFRAEFEPWVSSWWQPMQAVLSENRTRISDILICGGGANLARPLTQVSPKIKLSNSPQDSACVGLYRFLYNQLFGSSITAA